MRIILCILSVLVYVSCSQSLNKEHPLYTDNKTVKSENHIRIIGTKLFAIIPDNFQYNRRLTRYQTAENQEIIFSENPDISWSEYCKRNKGFSKGTIPLYGFNGHYIELVDSKSNKTNMIVHFGNENFVFTITAKTPNTVPEGRNQLIKILQSLYYDASYKIDELDLANFTFDRQLISEYTLNHRSKDSYYFSFRKDRSYPSPNKINFKSIYLPIHQKQEDLIKKQLVINKNIGTEFKSEEIRNEIIGKYEAKILQSEIKLKNKKGLYCHAILSDSINATEITVSGYEGVEKLDSIFMGILASVKLK